MPLDFFERIDAHFRKELPFVAYRKPSELVVKAIFQMDDRLHHLKSYDEIGFIFAPFDAEHPTVLIAQDEFFEISSNRFPTENAKLDRNKAPSDQEHKKSYIDLVKKAIDAIGKGAFKKVVLSRRIEIDASALPLQLFQKLLDHYPNAFCYLWYHPKVGVWLGATPEILLMLKNRQLTTMSLAGTQKYIDTEYPQWGQKEREEQQLVTDYIAEVLKGQVDRLKKSSTETLRAGNLLHLRTKITGVMAAGKLGGVVKALHPTPAVCGMPKESASEFIVNNENYPREFYTGFLGELNIRNEKQRSYRKKNQENQAYRAITKTTTLYVNLRCMQLKESKVLIYVGGGITKDSDAEREWEETVAKSTTILSIIV